MLGGLACRAGVWNMECFARGRQLPLWRRRCYRVECCGEWKVVARMKLREGFVCQLPSMADEERGHEFGVKRTGFLPGGEQETEGKSEMRDEYEGAYAFSMENLLGLKQS